MGLDGEGVGAAVSGGGERIEFDDGVRFSFTVFVFFFPLLCFSFLQNLLTFFARFALLSIVVVPPVPPPILLVCCLLRRSFVIFRCVSINFSRCCHRVDALRAQNARGAVCVK